MFDQRLIRAACLAVLASLVCVVSAQAALPAGLSAQPGSSAPGAVPQPAGPASLRYSHAWTGVVSNAWSNPGNWSPNGVPGSSSDVYIPTGLTTAYPVLSGLDATVLRLRIGAGASLTLGTGSYLYVTDFADIYGQLNITAAVDLEVNGSIHWYSGSGLNITNSSGEIYCGGNMTIDDGANVVFSTGYLDFCGSGNSLLYNFSTATRLNNLRTSKAYPGIFTLSSNSSADLIIKGSWFNYEGSRAYCNYTGNVVLWGSLKDYNVTAGRGVMLGAGTLVLDGINHELRFDGPDAYLAGLSVSCLGTASLATDVAVKGNLSLASGLLSAQGHTLALSGHWYNTVGSAGFAHGSGTVAFNKLGDIQSVSGLNIFHNVTNNHSGGFLQFENPTTIQGSLFVNYGVYFNDNATLNAVWNTNSGGVLNFGYTNSATVASYHGGGVLAAPSGTHVNIQDLADNALYGYLQVSDGWIEIHQDSAQFVDINCDLLITEDGIIDIHGGSAEIWVSANSVITMHSGELNIHDQDLRLQTVSTPNSGQFVILGGVIRCYRGWCDERGNFQPGGGTVEFAGPADCVVTPHPASWFQGLKVEKWPTRDPRPRFTHHRDGSVTPLTRTSSLSLGACLIKNGFTLAAASTVTLTGDVACQGAATNVIENGRLRLNGHALGCQGQVDILDGGVLDFYASSSLFMNNLKMLYVRSGGRLEALGHDGGWATLSHNGAGYWGLAVLNGGTLAASYCHFDYLDNNGLYLAPGSLVDSSHSLDHCSFAYGMAGGTLLNISNSQTFTVSEAYFNRVDGGSAHNVNKASSTGQVYFQNWHGAIGGPDYENDPHGRVWWSGGSGIPPVEDLAVSYVANGGQVRLDWSYPFPATSFRVYRGTSPEGPFSAAGTASGSATSWSEAVPGPRQFYRLGVIMP